MVAVIKQTARVTSHIVIAAFALVAIMLAVSVGLAIIQQPGHGRMRMILMSSSIAALFVVMALMMICYLIRKLGDKKRL